MLRRVRVSAVNGYSAGIPVLKNEFSPPLLKYKLPCLFKAGVWAVISTSSPKPFHIQMSVEWYQDYTSGPLQERAEELSQLFIVQPRLH